MRTLLTVVGIVVKGVTLATFGLFSSISVRLTQGFAALWRLLLVPLVVDLIRAGSAACTQACSDRPFGKEGYAGKA